MASQIRALLQKRAEERDVGFARRQAKRAKTQSAEQTIFDNEDVEVAREKAKQTIILRAIEDGRYEPTSIVISNALARKRIQTLGNTLIVLMNKPGNIERIRKVMKALTQTSADVKDPTMTFKRDVRLFTEDMIKYLNSSSAVNLISKTKNGKELDNRLAISNSLREMNDLLGVTNSIRKDARGSRSTPDSAGDEVLTTVEFKKKRKSAQEPQGILDAVEEALSSMLEPPPADDVAPVAADLESVGDDADWTAT